MICTNIVKLPREELDIPNQNSWIEHDIESTMFGAILLSIVEVLQEFMALPFSFCNSM